MWPMRSRVITASSLLTFRITDWLVGCFGFNGPLRQYFSLYRTVSQREGERAERIDESKNVQTIPTRSYCKRNRPCPIVIKIVGRPGTASLPSTIAPPTHKKREKEKRKDRLELKCPNNPTRTYCKRSMPLPYCYQNCRTPWHWKFTQHLRTTPSNY